MKIIHCADIHLDSKMEANLSYEQAQIRNNEICDTFARMVAYARDNKVRAVLIAGDMFDTGRVSSKTVDYVFDLISSAQEVDFLYLRGNHDESDRVFSGRTAPDNLKVFSDEWCFYDYDNVHIGGIELSQYNYEALYDALELPEDKINIIMLHGQIATQPGEDAVCLPRLRGRHIKYLALGHIHSYSLERLDSEGIFCYPGCLEGRGFDECGKKGFVLLNIGENSIETEFVPFARRTVYNVEVDISGLDSVAQITRAMRKASQELEGDSLVKFTLTGSFEPGTNKDLRFLTQSMSGSFFFVKVKDESRLHVAIEDYEHDASLKGEFIRRVMASSLSEEDRDRIIVAGIQALRGEEISL